MADFSLELRDNPADFTGASKGYKSSTLAGELFQGLGETVKMGVNAVDQFFQGSITQEATKEVDRVRDEFGVGASVAKNAGINANVLPEEIQTQSDRLGMLREAYKNGKLTSSNYWSQLDLVSRQLRYKYPGYREQIDQNMQKLTGATPANALRSAIEEEGQRAASAQNDATKRYLNLEEDASKLGIVEHLIRKQKGDPMKYDELQLAIAQRAKIKNDIQLQTSVLELKRAQGTATEKDTVDLMKNELGSSWNVMWQDANSAFAKDLNDFRSKMGSLKQGDPSRSFSAQEIESLKNTASSMRSKALELVTQVSSKYLGVVSAEEIKKSRESVMTMVDDQLGTLLDPKVGILEHNAAVLETIQKGSQTEMLQADESTRKVYGMNSLFGPVITDNHLRRKPETMVAFDLALSNGAKAKIASNPNQPVVKTFEELSSSKVTNPAVYKNLVDSTLESIVDEQNPKQMIDNLFGNLFGKGNDDFLMKLKQSERVQAFYSIQNPEVIGKMKTMKDSGKLSPQQWQTYKEWTIKNGTRLLSQEAQVAANINVDRKFINLSYNPETYSLAVSTNPRASKMGSVFENIDNMYEGYIAQPEAETSVQKINTLLQSLVPMIQADGSDPNEVIPYLIDKMGIKTTVDDTSKSSGGLRPLWSMVSEQVGKIQDKASELATKGKENLSKEPSPIINELIDSIKELKGPLLKGEKFIYDKGHSDTQPIIR